MAFINPALLPSDYIWAQYSVELLKNAVEANEAVNSHFESLCKNLHEGKASPAEKMNQTLVISGAKSLLSQTIFDFISETTHKLRPNALKAADIGELYLLTYLRGESANDRSTMGYFDKVPFEQHDIRTEFSTEDEENISENAVDPEELSEIATSLVRIQADDTNSELDFEGCLSENESAHTSFLNLSPVSDDNPLCGVDEKRETFTDADVSDSQSSSGSLSELSLALYLPPSEPDFEVYSQASRWEPTTDLSGPLCLDLKDPTEHVDGFVYRVTRCKIQGFNDIFAHSRVVCLCSMQTGLWFYPQGQTSEPVKVSNRGTYSMCGRYSGREVFTIHGKDVWLRKWDLSTGTPVEVGSSGLFKVKGGRCLSGVSISPGGLLAVSDRIAKRVTVHDQAGVQLFVLKEPFVIGVQVLDPNWLSDVCWLSEDRLAVKVWGGSLEDQTVVCIRAPEGTVCWRSAEIPGAWKVSCGGAQVYVSRHDSTRTIVALAGDSGEELRSVQTAAGVIASVVDRDGALSTVSYEWTDGA